MNVKSISMAIGLVLTVGGGLGAGDVAAGPRLTGILDAVRSSAPVEPKPTRTDGKATRIDADAPEPPGQVEYECNCPDPVSIHVVKDSGATSAVASDFPPNTRLNQAPYNATAQNLHFTDTLRWKLTDNRCCEVRGSVTIVIRNLGGINNNDAVTVVQGGSGVSGFSVGGPTLWGSAPTGQTRTLTYTLTQQMIDHRQLSVFVQDDTAVVSISVDIVGCCVNPRR